MFGGVVEFEINVLSFFSEDSYCFRCYQSDGEFVPDPRHSAEKARLSKLSFVLGTISCEIDDLSCLVIFDRCRRLAK